MSQPRPEPEAQAPPQRTMIAVLGASAPLGQALIEALAARGYAVRPLEPKAPPQATSLRGVAGVVDARAFDAQGPPSLLQQRPWMVAARLAQVKRYVWISSCATLWTGQAQPQDEASFYEPRSGWWAWADERYALEAEVYREILGGLRACVLIPAHVLDAGHPGSLGQQLRQLRRLTQPLGVALCWPQQVHVTRCAQVAHAALAALERGRVGRRYVVAGQPVALQALVQRPGQRCLTWPWPLEEAWMPWWSAITGAREGALVGASLRGVWAEQELGLSGDLTLDQLRAALDSPG